VSGEAWSAEDGCALLRLARRAIAARLEGRPPFVEPLPQHLQTAHAGAFVSLHRRDGELRGCIGFITAERPLPETVADAAIAAATRDTRFPPVGVAELPELVLEVSLLSPAEPIRADEVEVGRHGLILRKGWRTGLLLPQVPITWGWDRATYLEQLCRKAGLPPGSWCDPETELLAFTAQVFEEHVPDPALSEPNETLH